MIQTPKPINQEQREKLSENSIIVNQQLLIYFNKKKQTYSRKNGFSRDSISVYTPLYSIGLELKNFAVFWYTLAYIHDRKYYQDKERVSIVCWIISNSHLLPLLYLVYLRKPTGKYITRDSRSIIVDIYKQLLVN